MTSSIFQVINLVYSREQCISDLSESDIQDFNRVRTLLGDLRNLSLEIIEKVVDIRNNRNIPSNTDEFLPSLSPRMEVEWDEELQTILLNKNQNYLIRMLDDISCLSHSVQSFQTLLPPTIPRYRNPFLLSRGVDEMAVVSLSSSLDPIKHLEIVRFRNGSRVMLEEEARPDFMPSVGQQIVDEDGGLVMGGMLMKNKKRKRRKGRDNINNSSYTSASSLPPPHLTSKQILALSQAPSLSSEVVKVFGVASIIVKSHKEVLDGMISPSESLLSTMSSLLSSSSSSTNKKRKKMKMSLGRVIDGDPHSFLLSLSSIDPRIGIHSSILDFLSSPSSQSTYSSSSSNRETQRLGEWIQAMVEALMKERSKRDRREEMEKMRRGDHGETSSTTQSSSTDLLTTSAELDRPSSMSITESKDKAKKKKPKKQQQSNLHQRESRRIGGNRRRGRRGDDLDEEEEEKGKGSSKKLREANKTIEALKYEMMKMRQSLGRRGLLDLADDDNEDVEGGVNSKKEFQSEIQRRLIEYKTGVYQPDPNEDQGSIQSIIMTKVTKLSSSSSKNQGHPPQWVVVGEKNIIPSSSKSNIEVLSNGSWKLEIAVDIPNEKVGARAISKEALNKNHQTQGSIPFPPNIGEQVGDEMVSGLLEGIFVDKITGLQPSKLIPKDSDDLDDDPETAHLSPFERQELEETRCSKIQKLMDSIHIFPLEKGEICQLIGVPSDDLGVDKLVGKFLKLEFCFSRQISAQIMSSHHMKLFTTISRNRSNSGVLVHCTSTHDQKIDERAKKFIKEEESKSRSDEGETKSKTEDYDDDESGEGELEKKIELKREMRDLPIDGLNLEISDDELEILLLNHPTSFSSTLSSQWSSQHSLSSWILSRVSVSKPSKVKKRKGKNVISYEPWTLSLDRSISMSDSIFSNWVDNGGISRQNEDRIALSMRGDGGDLVVEAKWKEGFSPKEYEEEKRKERVDRMDWALGKPKTVPTDNKINSQEDDHPDFSQNDLNGEGEEEVDDNLIHTGEYEEIKFDEDEEEEEENSVQRFQDGEISERGFYILKISLYEIKALIGSMETDELIKSLNSSSSSFLPQITSSSTSNQPTSSLLRSHQQQNLSSLQKILSKVKIKVKRGWRIQICLNRTLIKQTQSISSHVSTISCSTLGSDLIFFSKASDEIAVPPGSFSKILREHEMRELLKSHSMISFLISIPCLRRELATLLLDEMRYVRDGSNFKLETSLVPDIHFLSVAILKKKGMGVNKGSVIDRVIGSVEIDEKLTLQDLRVVIKHEVDPRDVPPHYKFFMEESPVSIHQESKVKALRAFPKIHLVPEKPSTALAQEHQTLLRQQEAVMLAQQQNMMMMNPQGTSSTMMMMGGNGGNLPGSMNPSIGSQHQIASQIAQIAQMEAKMKSALESGNEEEQSKMAEMKNQMMMMQQQAQQQQEMFLLQQQQQQQAQMSVTSGMSPGMMSGGGLLPQSMQPSVVTNAASLSQQTGILPSVEVGTPSLPSTSAPLDLLKALEGESDDEDSDEEMEMLKNMPKIKERIYKSDSVLVPVPIIGSVTVSQGGYVVKTERDISEILSAKEKMRIGKVDSRDYTIPQYIKSHMIQSDPFENLVLKADVKKKTGNDKEDLPTIDLIKIEDPSELESKIDDTVKTDDDIVESTKEEEIDQQLKSDSKTPSTNKKKKMKSGFIRKPPIYSNYFIVDPPFSIKPKEDSNPSGAALLKKDEEEKKKEDMEENTTKKELTRTESRMKSMGTPKKGGKRKKDDLDESKRDVERGTIFHSMRIWRLIPEEEDIRPKWQFMYETGQQPWKLDWERAKDLFTKFRVNLKFSLLEKLIEDNWFELEPLYQQRVYFYPTITVNDHIGLAFQYICNSYFPRGDSLTLEKWNKFILQMKVFSDIKSPSRAGQIELVFSKEVKKWTEKKKRLEEEEEKKENPSSPKKKSSRGKRKKKKKEDESKTKKDDINNEEDSNHQIGNVVQGRNLNERGFGVLLREIAFLKYHEEIAIDFLATSAIQTSSSSSGDELLATSASHADLDLERMKDDDLDKMVEEIMTISIPGVREACWKEAKLRGMREEGRRQCGAIRIQAFVRKTFIRRLFLKKIAGAYKLQRWGRGRIMKSRIWRWKRQLWCDWIFRWRQKQATTIQSCFRTFLFQKRFRAIVATRKKEERQAMAKYRKKMKDRRRKFNNSVVFNESRRIGGVSVLLQMYRKDNRRTSKDYGVVLRTYIPENQTTFEHPIDEWKLRDYVETVTGTRGVSIAELYDKKNIKQVLGTRLIVRRNNQHQPKVLFSSQGLGTSGELAWKRGVTVSKKAFVIAVYRSEAEITFQAYYPKSSETLTTELKTPTLKKWLDEEEIHVQKRKENKRRKKIARCLQVCDDYREGRGFDQQELIFSQNFLREQHTLKTSLTAGSIGDSAAEEVTAIEHSSSLLLKEENQKSLFVWLFKRLMIRPNGDTGKMMLVLEYQVEDELRDEAAVLLQSICRRYIVRCRTYNTLVATTIIMIDPTSKRYYLNTTDGSTSWELPLILYGWSLPEPNDEWIRVKESAGGDGYYYVNPARGQVANLSPDKAAHIIQQLVRNYQSRHFLPHCLDRVIRSFKFLKTIEANYNKDKGRLSSIINFAVLSYAINHDEDTARPLFKTALEMSPNNPLVLRAYGIFLVASCETPRKPNFARGIEMIEGGNVLDPQHSKFDIAMKCFFQFAALLDPFNSKVFVTLAICHQCVYKDYDAADNLYRRAFALSPFDPNLIQNFEDFEEQRLPGGLYANTKDGKFGGGPGKVVVERSHLSEERVEWGEFKLMRDEYPRDIRFEKFWLNSFTNITSWSPPDWEVEMEKRVDRCQVMEVRGSWKILWDDIPQFTRAKGCYLFLNDVSGETSSESPFEDYMNRI